MIFDDYIGKDCVVCIEGNQNLGQNGDRAMFLGAIRDDGIVFLRILHYFDNEIPHGDSLVTVKDKNCVFIQLRKIKTIHFGMNDREADELLTVVFEDGKTKEPR